MSDNESEAPAAASQLGEPVAATPATPQPPVVQLTARRWFWPVVAGTGGLLVGALLGASIGSAVTGAVTAAQADASAKASAAAEKKAKSTLFADAAKRCTMSGMVQIADGGKTMVVDGAGEDFGSGDVDFAKLDCIISQVKTPTAIKTRMYETRSLDGRQEGDWGDIHASWTYHPDDGLDLIFELTR